jgi:solute carrier family 25 carnitine/acylcarnitine transporter 20/29
MLGSLTFYRRMLRENVFNPQTHRILAPNNARGAEPLRGNATKTLPTVGHCIAGLLAGFTVSLIAAPVEHIKARLQVQYAADKTARFYRGPIDCTRKIVRHHPIDSGFRVLSSMQDYQLR